MGTIVVVRAEGQVLVEDLGRPGWAHLGVPGSGALDPAALALANRLVGNAEGAAGLEVLPGVLELRAEDSVRVALTGAQLSIRVDGRAAAWGTAVSVPKGALLEIGRSPAGLRGWVAVAGGIELPVVLGSRSTDTLGGLGPPPLRAGDVLPVGRPGLAPEGGPVAVTGSSDAPGLRVWVGPRANWFTADSLQTLWGTTYEVTSAADRIAVRLRGSPLVRRRAGELASEGLVTGAVQVPGDGQPLVFLADHPTTGGYPVVAVVHPLDLWRCAQLRPGDVVRLVPAR